MFDFVLSLVVLSAFALFAGAVFLFRRGNRKQAGLMVLLAIVMILNAAIWMVPTADGDNPMERATAEGADAL